MDLFLHLDLLHGNYAVGMLHFQLHVLLQLYGEAVPHLVDCVFLHCYFNVLSNDLLVLDPVLIQVAFNYPTVQHLGVGHSVNAVLVLEYLLVIEIFADGTHGFAVGLGEVAADVVDKDAHEGQVKDEDADEAYPPHYVECFGDRNDGLHIILSNLVEVDSLQQDCDEEDKDDYLECQPDDVPLLGSKGPRKTEPDQLEELNSNQSPSCVMWILVKECH